MIDDLITGDGYPEGRWIELYGAESSGKAQPLSELILTPNGYIKMKDVEIGSIVSIPNGLNANVIGIYPQGVQEVYKITFSDGTFAYSTLDHLWTLHDRSGKQFTSSLEDIVNSHISNKTYLKYRLPDIGCIEFNKQNLELDPYLIGCLIGDGSISNSSIKISSADESIIENLSHILSNIGYYVTHLPNTYDYMISRRTYSQQQSAILHDSLRTLGLFGTVSNSKFIPTKYLNGSVDQRISLFQGLFDTDGHVGNGGTMSFTTVSRQLSDDFTYLARSLGMRVVTTSRYPTYSYNGELHTGQLAYTSFLMFGSFVFNISTLPRKQDRVKNIRSNYSYRYIKSVEFDRTEECQCIMIDSQDHLYITSNFIPTHNTTTGVIMLSKAQQKYPEKMVAVIDMEHAFAPKYAEQFGLNLADDKFLMCQPNSGEEALEITRELAGSGLFSAILFDSVGAIVTQKQLSNGIDDETMGAVARLLSKSASQINIASENTKTTIIWINQVRSKIVIENKICYNIPMA